MANGSLSATESSMSPTISFVDQNELKRHIEDHFKQNPFECDMCAKKFRKKECLCRHLERHVGKIQPKTFKCKMCPKEYDFAKPLAKQKYHYCSGCGL